MTRPTPEVRTAAPHDITSHLSDLRAALHQQRRFRVEQLDELTAAAADTPPTADEPRTEVAHAVRAAATAALTEIDAALHRLEHGGYGVCKRCEAAIPLERMEILPMARLCMPCQHAEETRRTTAPPQAADVVNNTGPGTAHSTNHGDRRRRDPDRHAQRLSKPLDTNRRQAP
jgi:DnaK suppressor protein